MATNTTLSRTPAEYAALRQKGLCSKCGINQRAENDTWCLTCKAEAERSKWEVRRIKQVLAKYNLSLEQYQAMVNQQNGVCKICQHPNTSSRDPSQGAFLCVDHDHTTGEVRGLLCRHCNTGIGAFRDDPDLLHQAIKYLGGTNGVDCTP